MNHRNWRAAALRVGMLPAGIAIALAPGLASAQEGGKDATNLDRIEVTGSRIRQASLETAQPVLTLSRADIQEQGFTSIADILQNISAVGSPAISRADALASGEEVGGQYVDLRNLGAQRTLVLIDGKRMGTSTGGYSDLSSIPTSIVERIEVLADGASALYGSDAVAGVVNVITRKNFDGAEASAYIGQYDQGDGEKQIYNFLIGSAGERSQVSLGVEYSDEKSVNAADRVFTRYPMGPYHPAPYNNSNNTVTANGWLASSPYGYISNGPCGGGLATAATRALCGGNGGRTWTANPGADSTNFANYHPTGAADFADSNLQMLLNTGIERRSVFANGSFDISDNVRFVTDVLYTHRETEQQIAGYPYSSTAYGTPMSANSYFNPLDRSVNFVRRTWEVPRKTFSELTTYRFTGGLEGSLELADKPWDWSLDYVYNQNKGVKTGTGNLFVPNVELAVGPSFLDVDGVVKCGTAANPIAGCMPWNPLSHYGANEQGNLSNRALQDFLFYPTHDTSNTTTQVFSASLSGVLAELPAGDLGMATGFEHRKESGRFEPDALKQSGLSTDLAGGPTEGSYSLNELFLEFNIPILADIAGAKELSLDVAGRYSDYSTFGDTINGKFGLKWKPIDSLLLRAAYGTGFRAPAINDLYGGLSETFDSFTDSCDSVYGPAARNPEVAARCATGGVPANFRQLSASGTPVTGPGTQTGYPFASGSNPNLKPEESKSRTVGVVYSPEWAEGLDLSLQWWKIRIDNVISYQTATDVLDGCYVLGVQANCSQFARGTEGPSSGEQVTQLLRIPVNQGYMETAGYDFGVTYRLPETSFGRFKIDWQSTYVDYLETKGDNAATTPVEQFTGWGGNFRLRSNMNLDWSYGDFGASWMIRYYSSMKEACAYDMDGGPECNLPDFVSAYTLEQPSRTVGSNTFHDVQFRYNTPWNATVSLGANNVFDHEGPILYSKPNSDFVYSGEFPVGRFWYLKYQQRF